MVVVGVCETFLCRAPARTREVQPRDERFLCRRHRERAIEPSEHDRVASRALVWHVARSETASRALVSSAGFSTKTRRGFPESRWQQNQVSLVFFIFWSKGLSRKGRRRQPTSAPPRTRRRVTCDGKRDRQTMEMTTSLDSAMRVPERHRRDILRYFEGSRATSFPHDTSARHDDAYTFLPRRAGRSLLFFCRYASRDVLRSSSLLPPPDS